MAILTSLNLNPEVEAFLDKVNSSGKPPIYKLTPTEARSVLETLQSGPVDKPKVSIEEKKIPFRGEQISLNIVRPQQTQQTTQKLRTLVFFHGAGWVMGSFKTHERLVSDIAFGANVNVVFVNYSLSPEAKFPTAIEQAYEATKYVSEHGNELNLDTTRLSICGDSVGGNMSIAVALLAKERGGPKIDSLVLFYPVTSSELNTTSYNQFSEGLWLTKPAMEWFWNNYESSNTDRKKPLLSPLNTPLDQLKNFPETLVITAEYDVLRDEGEAFAHKLFQAGVKSSAVRILGTIHDFVMINELAKTLPTRTAITLANQFLKDTFS